MAGRSTRSLDVMKVAVWFIAAITSAASTSHAAEFDAVEVSEALVRHVARYSYPNQAPEVICLSASVPEHVQLLVERLRGAAPLIQTSSECRLSSSSQSKRLWVNLGVPVKEAEGVFLQSIDYGSSSHCVFRARRDGSGQWNISINTPCVVS